MNEQLPSPEERQHAIEYALKNSKWAQKAVCDKQTDEEKAQKRLEEYTLNIFNTCAQIKTLDIERGGTYDEVAMGRLALTQWMDVLKTEDQEALMFMLATVCSGAMLEAIGEL